MDAVAVIGANFGDEGKGAVVDGLARPGGLVVRFSGGAQAGHTVVAPDGRRHVFHHLGSGTFRGAATYLAPRLVCNPALFARERDELRGDLPPLHVDRRCLLTTPFDMMLNQAVEAARGAKRHGSCGVGINETVVRCGYERYALRAADVTSGRLARRLEVIRHEYVPRRLAELGLAPDALGRFGDVAQTDKVVERYVAEALSLVAGRLCDPDELAGAYGHVVFEGAQGLGLDERAYGFPHVTRARTGIDNALEAAAELGAELTGVVYVTRAYLTRHGPGPLPNELDGAPPGGDETNVANEHQGPLRYAHLDIDGLARRVRTDALKHGRRAELTVTCLDQVSPGPCWAWRCDWLESFVSPERLALAAADACGVDRVHGSYGPTRDDARTLADLLEVAP